MFPIITQKCIKSSSSDNSLNKDNFFKIENFLNKNLTDGVKGFGVYASERIKCNTVSCDIASADLIGQLTSERKYQVRASNVDGFLRTSVFKKDQHSWLRSIKLSKDVHSHNTMIELSRNGLIRARIVKDILCDEELITWFSEECLMLMSIPFLTPANIRGNNCYKCHNCHKTFEYPNPLKIHLATICEHQTLEMLWMKLHYTLIKTASAVVQQHNQQQIFNQQAATKSSLYARHDLLMRSTLASYDRRHQSAFKPIHQPPIRHQLLHHHQSDQSSSPPQLPPPALLQTRSPPQLPPTTSSAAAASQASQATNAAEAAALNAAQQIETIVSNMGASKQGHLCIYCGKIYSRKYGLKIHIRTHTGFKPLKCKFCLRPFGDPSNLNKHVRLHLQTGNLTYRCHLCHKTLARRRDLQRHIETKHCTLQRQQEEGQASS